MSGGTCRRLLEARAQNREQFPSLSLPLLVSKKCFLCSKDIFLSRKVHLSNNLSCLLIPDVHDRCTELVGVLLQGFREALTPEFPWAFSTESAPGSQHASWSLGLWAQVGVADLEGEGGPP